MENRHSRQSFLGPNVESVAERSRVTIVGLCGGGSHVAQQLAHIGFGHFELVDNDAADDTNTNRMVGLTHEEAQREELKVNVVRQRILAINPKANVVIHPKRWEQVSGALKGSTVIFGCVDSYSVRDELERFARRYLIPYIDVGMDVHGADGNFNISGQVILSLPDQPCMRCFGFITDERLAEEAQKYGKAGGKPQVVWPNGVLASTAVAKFMQLILPWRAAMAPPLFTEYDGNRLILQPSNKIAAVRSTCPHFAGDAALGDIDWG